MQFYLHTFVEIMQDSVWELQPEHKLFNALPYIYAPFFLNVRNYGHYPFIANPRGLPKDINPATRAAIKDLMFPHDFSWFDLIDLNNFNYQLPIIRPKRDTKVFANSGFRSNRTPKFYLKDYLTPDYFQDLDKLNNLSYKTRIILAVEG